MITLHHLNESRSQRILWLLEELGLAYEIVQHQRDPKTRLSPPSLQAVHPLGKAPVLVDGGLTLIESAAIVDHLIRRHGGGRLQPDPASDAYSVYQQWLHYAEGSAMLPLMLKLYVGRLGEAGAPLAPRIESEIGNHLGFLDRTLAGKTWLMGDELTGADVQMSFVGEAGRSRGGAERFPNLSAWVDRIHQRPAWLRGLERGGPYQMGR